MQSRLMDNGKRIIDTKLSRSDYIMITKDIKLNLLSRSDYIRVKKSGTGNKMSFSVAN